MKIKFIKTVNVLVDVVNGNTRLTNKMKLNYTQRGGGTYYSFKVNCVGLNQSKGFVESLYNNNLILMLAISQALIAKLVWKLYKNYPIEWEWAGLSSVWQLLFSDHLCFYQIMGPFILKFKYRPV